MQKMLCKVGRVNTLKFRNICCFDRMRMNLVEYKASAMDLNWLLAALCSSEEEAEMRHLQGMPFIGNALSQIQGPFGMLSNPVKSIIIQQNTMMSGQLIPFAKLMCRLPALEELFLLSCKDGNLGTCFLTALTLATETDPTLRLQTLKRLDMDLHSTVFRFGADGLGEPLGQGETAMEDMEELEDEEGEEGGIGAGGIGESTTEQERARILLQWQQTLRRFRHKDFRFPAELANLQSFRGYRVIGLDSKGLNAYVAPALETLRLRVGPEAYDNNVSNSIVEDISEARLRGPRKTVPPVKIRCLEVEAKIHSTVLLDRETPIGLDCSRVFEQVSLLPCSKFNLF